MLLMEVWEGDGIFLLSSVAANHEFCKVFVFIVIAYFTAFGHL